MVSHIYYEILPVYRSKGYGKRILALGLEKAKEIGLKEISITCMEDNTGSKKIIEVNGGIFVEDAVITGENKKMLKYRILLSDPDTSN
jgi:predicted acetyltransferase